MGSNYLNLPGTAGAFAGMADSDDFDFSTGFDIRFGLEIANTRPASNQWLISKAITAGQLQFDIFMRTTGVCTVRTSADGTNLITSNADTALASGTNVRTYLRFTVLFNDGANHNVVRFYQGSDGASWGQFATAVQNPGTTSLKAGSDPVGIGAQASTGAQPFAGKLFLCDIRNNLNDDGTGIVRYVDPTIVPVGATSFSESSVNAATVMINGASSIRSLAASTAAIFPILFD